MNLIPFENIGNLITIVKHFRLISLYGNFQTSYTGITFGRKIQGQDGMGNHGSPRQ